MSTTPEGLLDTNVVVHAFASDAHGEECRQFLASLESGQAAARLEPYVLHELSYALPCYLKQLTRHSTAEVLLSILTWPGVVMSNLDLAVDAIRRWAASNTLAFVDALLIAAAVADGRPIYSKNVAELRAHGATVPASFPGT